MMTTLRLVLHDGPQILERRFVAFPVRIGRDPENDCSILDRRPFVRSYSHIICAILLKAVSHAGPKPPGPPRGNAQGEDAKAAHAASALSA